MSITPSDLNLTTVGELGTAAITDDSYFPHTILGGLLKKAKVSSLYVFLQIESRAGDAGRQAGRQASILYVNSIKGRSGGIATLDEDGRITPSQLRPNSGEVFLGAYNAHDNTPDIINAQKQIGGYYIVSVAGYLVAPNQSGTNDSYALSVGDKLIWDGQRYAYIPNIPDFAPESSLTAFRQV